MLKTHFFSLSEPFSFFKNHWKSCKIRLFFIRWFSAPQAKPLVRPKFDLRRRSPRIDDSHLSSRFHCTKSLFLRWLSKAPPTVDRSTINGSDCSIFRTPSDADCPYNAGFSHFYCILQVLRFFRRVLMKIWRMRVTTPVLLINPENQLQGEEQWYQQGFMSLCCYAAL